MHGAQVRRRMSVRDVCVVCSLCITELGLLRAKRGSALADRGAAHLCVMLLDGLSGVFFRRSTRGFGQIF